MVAMRNTLEPRSKRAKRSVAESRSFASGMTFSLSSYVGQPAVVSTPVESKGIPFPASISFSQRLGCKTRYYHNGWRATKERDGSDAIQSQYVWGNYLDEVWTIDDRTGAGSVADLNDGTGSERHFYHCNTLYHIFANTDETGALAEAVQSYDAYGKVSALITGAGTDTAWFTADDVLAANPNVSAIGNPWFYTGQRLDAETGLMYYKNRYYSVDLGRFVSRDPIGYRGGSPNLYEYAGSNPCLFTDTIGLASDQFGNEWHHLFSKWFFGDNNWLQIYISHATHVLIDTGRTGISKCRHMLRRGEISRFGATLLILKIYLRYAPQIAWSMVSNWISTGTFPIRGAGTRLLLASIPVAAMAFGGGLYLYYGGAERIKDLLGCGSCSIKKKYCRCYVLSSEYWRFQAGDQVCFNCEDTANKKCPTRGLVPSFYGDSKKVTFSHCDPDCTYTCTGKLSYRDEESGGVTEGGVPMGPTGSISGKR